MDLYDLLGALPVDIEDCTLHRRERDTSSGFTRVTTTIELHGDGVVGRGEDVTYETADHDALLNAGAPELAGEYTHAEFSAMVNELELFPAPPRRRRPTTTGGGRLRALHSTSRSASTGSRSPMRSDGSTTL